MRNIMLMLISLAAATLLAGGPAQAYYNGPWCGVSSIGRGSAVEKCDYRTFEACRMDIIAGNRGFCRPNGYFQGYAASGPSKARKKRKHVHY
jgi:hypothetical protein